MANKVGKNALVPLGNDVQPPITLQDLRTKVAEKVTTLSTTTKQDITKALSENQTMAAAALVANTEKKTQKYIESSARLDAASKEADEGLRKVLTALKFKPEKIEEAVKPFNAEKAHLVQTDALNTFVDEQRKKLISTSKTNKWVDKHDSVKEAANVDPSLKAFLEGTGQQDTNYILMSITRDPALAKKRIPAFLNKYEAFLRSDSSLSEEAIAGKIGLLQQMIQAHLNDPAHFSAFSEASLLGLLGKEIPQDQMNKLKGGEFSDVKKTLEEKTNPSDAIVTIMLKKGTNSKDISMDTVEYLGKFKDLPAKQKELEDKFKKGYRIETISVQKVVDVQRGLISMYPNMSLVKGEGANAMYVRGTVGDEVIVRKGNDPEQIIDPKDNAAFQSLLGSLPGATFTMDTSKDYPRTQLNNMLISMRISQSEENEKFSLLEFLKEMDSDMKIEGTVKLPEKPWYKRWSSRRQIPVTIVGTDTTAVKVIMNNVEKNYDVNDPEFLEILGRMTHGYATVAKKPAVNP